MMIIPTFIGWWELGRTITLDLTEIAKAFDAPLLKGPGSNACLEKLFDTIGRREVGLGEVECGADTEVPRKQLKLASPDEVTMSKAGSVYE